MSRQPKQPGLQPCKREQLEPHRGPKPPPIPPRPVLCAPKQEPVQPEHEEQPPQDEEGAAAPSEIKSTMAQISECRAQFMAEHTDLDMQPVDVPMDQYYELLDHHIS